MATRRARKLKSLVTKTAELALAAPQVVAHRAARMAAAGPVLSARDRKEFQLMGVEKVAAFTESWNAMALQAFRANQALAASLFRAFWSPWLGGNASARVTKQMHGAVLGVLVKGVTPVHRRATANAKRLARTKRR